MRRFNRSIKLNQTDKRILTAARQLSICEPLFDAGGMSGVSPRQIGLIVHAITEALAEPMDDVCHGLAKLSASGRFLQ